MTLYEEIVQVVKMPRKGSESFEDFAKRVTKKINGSWGDANWSELSEELQAWHNTAMPALEQEAPVPALEGWPEEEPEEESAAEDESTADEAEADDDSAASDEAEGEGDAEEATAEEDVDSGDDSGQEAPQEEEATLPRKPKAAKKASAKKAAPPKPPKKATKPTAKGKAKEMATKPASKPAKAAASANARTRIGGEGVIKILIKDNPHRKGTKLFGYFSKYKDGMTVDQALRIKIPQRNIYYESELGHIKVVSGKKAA